MAPGTYVVEADGRKRKATEEELDAAAQFFTAIPDGVRAGEGCPATVEAKWTAAVREGRADEVAADWAARAAAAQNGGAKATEARGGSWRVELTTDDGRRLMNGARYGTKQEASLYAASGIHVAVFMNGLTVVAIRLLESGDAPNQSLRHPKDHRKAGQLRDTLAIKDGECVYHNWHVEGEETAPACGNDTDPEASAEAMKAKHAALDAMN
jgi:hypothetical protein